MFGGGKEMAAATAVEDQARRLVAWTFGSFQKRAASARRHQ